jgi:ribonuclease HII
MVNRVEINLSELELPSQRVAGVDEVGRGALFGPVIAAAVILSPAALTLLQNLGVTDSKQLSAKQRQQLAQQIRTVADACCIGLASAAEIDRLNILQASLLAMRRAVLRLQPQPQLCLIDGNQLIPNLEIAQQAIVQGDQKSTPIAAASIVAKVWRDQLLVQLEARYPGYGLKANKGYGTAKHKQAIQQLGLTRYHRRSFSPCQLAQEPIPGLLDSSFPWS